MKLKSKFIILVINIVKHAKKKVIIMIINVLHAWMDINLQMKNIKNVFLTQIMCHQLKPQ